MALKQRSRSMGFARQMGKSSARKEPDKKNNVYMSISKTSHVMRSSLLNAVRALYLYGKHSTDQGCSRSGSDMCCQRLLWFHFEHTVPKHTSDHHSTPHPGCRAKNNVTFSTCSHKCKQQQKLVLEFCTCLMCSF